MPFLDNFLVAISLSYIAGTAKGLKVSLVKEVSACRPGNDMVDHLGGDIAPALQALRAYGVLSPPPAAEPGPAIGVIRIVRPRADVALPTLRL